jgi:hypothetical protein
MKRGAAVWRNGEPLTSKNRQSVEGSRIHNNEKKKNVVSVSVSDEFVRLKLPEKEPTNQDERNRSHSGSNVIKLFSSSLKLQDK